MPIAASRMSMGESHRHGRTTSPYGGVTGVTFRIIADSSASGTSSASSLIQFFSIVLNVHYLPQIVVIIQYEYPNLIPVGEPHAYGRIAWEWENRMRMGEPHAHMTESTESLSASLLSILLHVLREVGESLRPCLFSPPSLVFSTLWQSPRVRMKERGEHGRT